MNALLENPVLGNAHIEQLEGAMFDAISDGQIEAVDCPLEHFYAPHVYVRQIRMKAGAFIIGQCHKTEHLNQLIQGRCRVIVDGVVHELVAPYTFVSKAGVRKCLYILEDCIWATTHVTDETDLGVLEELLIEKSATFLSHDIDRIKTSIAAS